MRLGELYNTCIDRICYSLVALVAGHDFDIPPIREESGHDHEEEREGARTPRVGVFNAQTESLRTIGRGIVSTGIAVFGGEVSGHEHRLTPGEIRRQGLGYSGNYRKID